MPLAQEVRDFVAAFTGMKRAIGDPEDKKYKQLRNQLLQWQLERSKHNEDIKQQLYDEWRQGKAGLGDRARGYAPGSEQQRPIRPEGPSPLNPKGDMTGADDPSQAGAAATTPTDIGHNFLNNPNGALGNQQPTTVTTGAPPDNMDNMDRPQGQEPPEDSGAIPVEEDVNRNVGEGDGLDPYAAAMQ